MPSAISQFLSSTEACLFLSGSSPAFRRHPSSSPCISKSNRVGGVTKRLAVSVDEVPATRSIEKRGLEKEGIEWRGEEGGEGEEEGEGERPMSGWKAYFEESKELIKSDGGPPRWFSPLYGGSRLNNSPLLLFLPGIDGVGLGLILNHQKLGKVFDMWCLHIPVMDRTPFTELVKMVERTVRSENQSCPNRPIYLVGDSLGACLALAVAARNPDIDLVLILANPATSYCRSQLQQLTPLLEAMPGQLSPGVPYFLSLMAGDPLRMVLENMVKGLSLQNTARELSEDLSILSSSLPVLADILPRETLLWKLQMLRSASAYASSRLHSIKTQILILSRSILPTLNSEIYIEKLESVIRTDYDEIGRTSPCILDVGLSFDICIVSGKDQLLPSQQEGERLYRLLPKCDLRKFDDRGHFLFLEGGFDLLTIIKSTSFYRRGKYHDYALDFIPPSPDELKNVLETNRLFNNLTSAVMLSTLEDGTIVRGLDGIPSEGPVLLVGYHMLLGCDLVPLATKIASEKKILVRGIAHPMMFERSKTGKLPELSSYDSYRLMGAVPVAASNFYKLFSSKAHVLLYPGGMREALHRKGEEYKLFWPEQAEFVRMAARFGAKIVPFGSVGEDDLGQVVIDYDDLIKVPYFRTEIESLTKEAAMLRGDAQGEVANQQVHLPGILPKYPGRFYYYFGKPIETKGRERELRDRGKSHELYMAVKSEVERCIAYLKEKRESDPYRYLLPRLLYQATHGFTSDVPTFEI